MSGAARPSAGSSLAVVAAATTWASTLAWRGFTEEPQRFLGPLAVIAVLVAVTGALLRWWGTPGVVVVAVQVVVGGMVACAFIGGSPVPLGGGWESLRDAFVQAKLSANAYAPPVPAEAPGVDPFLIAGGLGCLLLVDVLACTLRRAPLAGIPLLTVYSVPVGMLGISLVWWVFALTALGYLVLLHLEQGERVRRWGRTLETSEPIARGGGATPGLMRLQASAIGGGVTALAVIVPLAIPTLSVQLLDIGRGPGGDDDIQVVNPTTDLRRDLFRGRDVPLVRIATDDPDPDYLRIATLNRFSRSEWSSGDRDIPSSQVASGELPPLQGVAAGVARTPYTYSARATDLFDSTWLPAPSTATSIDAIGDWRFDTTTMDFIASDDDLTTSGMAWDFTADDLDLDATSLAAAGGTVGLVDTSFTDLPSRIDPYVRRLAVEVTQDQPSPYEKAVALQNWFRDSGNFTYSLDTSLQTSADDLLAFLSPDGRVGYCEQFASAMAVMARQLGIPARVAVGFLEPERVDDGVFEFSSYDLHAWPELFIPGGGWVRFEPTPAARAAEVPGYTADSILPEDPDGLNAPEGADADDALPQDAQPIEPRTPGDTQETAADDTADGSGAWWPWALAALGLLVVAGLAALPGLLRRRRRERRRTGDVEVAWTELRDTAADLGLAWPEGRSPQETGTALAAAVGRADDLPALDRLVLRLERSRFAPSHVTPSPADADELQAEVDEVVAAMEAAVTPGARRRATWVPRSVFRRGSGRDPVAVEPDGEATSEHLLQRL